MTPSRKSIPTAGQSPASPRLLAYSNVAEKFAAYERKVNAMMQISPEKLKYAESIMRRNQQNICQSSRPAGYIIYEKRKPFWEKLLFWK